MPIGLGEYRDREEEAISEEQLMAWATNAKLLKAVRFEGEGQFHRQA